MIDLAVIASTPHLDHLSAAGSIDLALAQLVLRDPAYADYFRRRARAGVTVILDNGAYELHASAGAGMGAEPVLTAAERIGARVVVCQDIPFDSTATIAATRTFLRAARDGRARRFMAVPQGTTRREWLDCYRRLADMPEIELIGLSKLSVPRCFGAPTAEARMRCVTGLLEVGAVKPFHLLGGDQSLPWELVEHRRRGHDRIEHGGVVSSDSSFAFWYAANGVPVDPHSGRADREVNTKPDLSTTVLDSTCLRAAFDNVAHLRRAAGLPAVPDKAAPDPVERTTPPCP